MGEDQGWIHWRQHLVVEGRVRCVCIRWSWCVSATGAYFCKARPKDQTREGPRAERNPLPGTTSFFHAVFPFASFLLSPPPRHKKNLGFIFDFLLRSFPFCLFCFFCLFSPYFLFLIFSLFISSFPVFLSLYGFICASLSPVLECCLILSD